MTCQRVTLVHNPTAGDQQIAADALVRAVADAGYEVKYESSKGARLERALRRPTDLVVAAGGDGTVRKVAVLLAELGTAPLAILPIGTANNIAKSFGVLGLTRELVEWWARSERRRIDVGLLSGRGETRMFVESVGGGIFTELIRRGKAQIEDNVAALTGNEIDRALLVLQRVVREARPRPWRLDLDGEDLSGNYLAVEAMNVHLIGPNVPLAASGNASDGLLDVVTIGPDDRDALLAYLEGRLRGGGTQPRFPSRKGRRLLALVDDAALHADDERWPGDGETAGRAKHSRSAGRSDARVELTVRPGSLEVLLPPS
ncbi:MAG: diacylglycerol/lipid kinase family protein [Gemmatimonadaceae bacterium]